jgi:uncharacterized protein (DUF2336 family)
MSGVDKSELEGLLELARDRSVEGRTQLATIVGDLFFATGSVLTEPERALMGDILRRLIHDVEMTVRRSLAERLAHVPAAPRELVAMLANDEIEVAYPILVDSTVLHDIDLIEVIRHRTLQHQLAIARRSLLSAAVSGALVEAGNRDVITTLLENQHAEIAERTMAFLVEESRRVDAYQRPLLRRRELGPELARRMYSWVSAALREHLVQRFNIDPALIETDLAETLDQAAAEARKPTKTAELAQRLGDRGAINARLLIQALREGKIALFENLLSELTGLRPVLIRRFIYERGGQSLAVACRSAEIAKPDFASILLLSRGARPGDKTVDNDEVTEALAFFDRVKPGVAKKVAARWRIDPDFAFASKQPDRDAADRRLPGRTAS